MISLFDACQNLQCEDPFHLCICNGSARRPVHCVPPILTPRPVSPFSLGILAAGATYEFGTVAYFTIRKSCGGMSPP